LIIKIIDHIPLRFDFITFWYIPTVAPPIIGGAKGYMNIIIKKSFLFVRIKYDEYKEKKQKKRAEKSNPQKNNF